MNKSLLSRIRCCRLTVGSTVLLLSLTLFAACGGSRRDHPPALKERRSEQVAQKVPALLLRRFQIFRLPVASEPPAVLQRPRPTPFGMKWALAHRLHGPVWAAPARERICLAQQQPDEGLSVVCTRISQILDHSIFIVSLKDPSMQGLGFRREIVGLAPDGTRKVRLITPGYRTATVPVDHGVFVHRDDIPASPLTTTLLPK